MTDKNLRVYGAVGAIFAIAIWFYFHGYWVFSFLIGVPATVLLIKSDSLSNAIIKSISQEFSTDSFFEKINPLLKKLNSKLDYFKNIHIKASIISILFVILISSIIVLVLIIVAIAVVLAASKSNGGVSGGGGKRPNVIFSDPSVVVGSMNPLSMGRWEIRYGSRERPTEKSMTISPSTTGSTAGGGCRITWS